MSGTRPSVMVIDDDHDVCEVYAEVLRDAGYDVISAHDGNRAFELLQHSVPRPGVILVDLMMPFMDGGTFLRQQSADPRLSQVPVVVMSAGRRPADLHGVAYLQKPVSLEELLRTVATYIKPREDA